MKVYAYQNTMFYFLSKAQEKEKNNQFKVKDLYSKTKIYCHFKTKRSIHMTQTQVNV